MKGALRARIIAAVGSLVAPYTPPGETPTRAVFWLDRPQGSVLPSITLQTISNDRPQHMAGFQSTRTARVQMDVWAATLITATQIMDAAVMALRPKETSNGIEFGVTFFEDERDFAERLETKTIYRTSVDLIVWHSPA